MHTSISGYLSALTDKGRSPLAVKAARGDLLGFAAWVKIQLRLQHRKTQQRLQRWR
jgi:hypothetical protein